MNWMTRFLMGQMLLMDKAGDGGSGGGGGGSGSGQGGQGGGQGGGSGGQGGGQGGSGGQPQMVTMTKEQFDAIMARLPQAGGGQGGGQGGGSGGQGGDGGDLAEKARREREEREKQTKNQSALESALKFNLGGAEFMKANASLLPKSVESIFQAAEKENYGSAIEKAAAIKVGILSEFFALEENMNHLTGPQKFQVEEFKKLTKTDKQDRAAQIWDSIFEPTFEMVKKIKRAQEMANGQKSQTDGEKALADRMMKLSKKHYLGEKDA
jgi:hypothetical protein